MKKLFLFLALIPLAGCVYNPPVKTEFDNRISLPMDYDHAWRKAVQSIAADGFLIKVADKQNGIITTEKKTIQLNETQADCGNIWGIPYTKDKRTVTDVALSIVLKDEKDRTSLVVNSQIDGTFNATADMETKKLSCTSTGAVEQDFIRQVSNASL